MSRGPDGKLGAALAALSKDLKDAEALLLRHRAEIDLARVRTVLDHLGEMSDEPGLSRRVEEIDKTKPRAPVKRRSLGPPARARRAKKKS